MDHCKACGAALRKKDRYCPSCGAAAPPRGANRAQPDRGTIWKLAAAALSVFGFVAVCWLLLSYSGLLPAQPPTEGPPARTEAQATPAPAAQKMIDVNVMRDLCVPLGCISEQYWTPWLDPSTGRVSNEFASRFLYSYANAVFPESRAQHAGVFPYDPQPESIRLTPQQVDELFCSVFGDGAFLVGQFRPDGTGVVEKDGAFYALAGSHVPNDVVFAGREAAPYDPEAEYLYHLKTSYLSADGSPRAADMYVRLVENPESIYGYSVASVRYGSPFSASEFIDGMWRAEKAGSHEYKSGEVWYLSFSQDRVVRYADRDHRLSLTPSGVYGVHWSANGRATLEMLPDSGEDFFGEDALLEIMADDALVIHTGETDYTLLREPPEGSNLLTPDAAITGSFDENGFLISDSSENRLTDHVLASLIDAFPGERQEALGWVKNEIYARHGQLFEDVAARTHYEQYGWYNDLPKKYVAFEELNEVEQANVLLLEGWMA